MSLLDHIDYKTEEKRLKETVNYIEKSIESYKKNKTMHQKEIKDAYSSLDPTESSQSYVSIMLHTRLLDELENNYARLLKAIDNPYFARIDFREEDKSNIEKFYIGKMSLQREDWDVPMILDWRSPLASVYYDGRLGNVVYQNSLGESLSGELSLKRQYTIENKQLLDIMDVDITATDTFLQASLGENKDNRLKDIVSTIQSEQNAIIRADIKRPLIVQGVAGSGKTTIALHRIAYLIYTYEKSFYPEQFMIIAPNRLFLNYISGVLPELGANNVIQTTYADYAFKLIGDKYNLTDSEEKLVHIINDDYTQLNSNKKSLVIKSSAFKGSLTFINILLRYIKNIEINYIPKEDFELEGHLLMSVKEIKNIILRDYNHLPLYKRFEQVEKHLKFRLDKEKDRIYEQTKLSYDKKIEIIRRNEPESEERRLTIVDILNIRDAALQKVKKNIKIAVKTYMSKFIKRDLFDYYKDIITNEENLNYFSLGKLDDKFASFICQYSNDILKGKMVELEDLAPLLFIKHRIMGFEDEINIKYVVIDEAQDFSPFQFYALKKMFNTDFFTILGDLSQGIHSYRSIKNWNIVLNKIFDTDNSQYLKLEQSYRTTIEIMDLANEVIKLIPKEDLIIAKPVVRHGEIPSIAKFKFKKDIINEAQKKIIDLISEGYKSIAVICKTPKECKSVHNELKKNKQLNIKLLEGKEEQYDNTIVIVPSYLSKGLEFDAVIIININDIYSEDELDLKLLYVSMTRAQHKLFVYYKEGKNNLLERISLGSFQN
ncbi:DNA helicase-2/ATP-dependent DNA helicase PcrA [Sedimentibacter acidaminivorans]|uniref:DNA 3'-5' helicase n=1 Tax=Sedimentibacter acidaminivorans TaxID=913099 RepID=A0ABS4GDB4_9FIRM|nr:RNA polymerase recycling motor HelD [Sedimentibacter acidaminivorans]MBP1925380.1 DNA helicase-2/ATP-dependent DNA helicase PcrA [Sedimentibacter acidaminivorans]